MHPKTLLCFDLNNLQLAIQLFFQIAVILIACQLVGMIAKRMGQPQVVAEMVTGVLLGPSLFGLFLPEMSAKLFPADSMKVLFPISQLGLAIYMFVVGLEFRMDIVQKRLRSAIAVSAAGMVAPFLLGAALGWYFFHHTELFPEKTSMTEAAMFLGAAMCITAFPMLARIIRFKGLTGTTMGTVALGAGAIDDATAWCLLAVVLASFDGDMSHALMNVGGGAAYTAFAIFVLRPLLARWAKGIEARGVLSDAEFVRCLVLLDSWYLWAMTGLVMIAAVGGKGIACWLAARATGIPNREALGIGTLMNSRGLMELIIINIGLQRGVISPALFAILVIMAVVTTLMTSPLFERLVGRHRFATDEGEPASVPVVGS